MLRLAFDVNIEGYLDDLLRELQSETWRDLWQALDVQVATFEELGLARNAPDSVVWSVCQRTQTVIVTANRNAKGDDSLEATLRRESTLESLPVITIPDPPRLRSDKDYRRRAAEKLLAYLMDMNRYRGAGRLYIPGEAPRHA